MKMGIAMSILGLFFVAGCINLQKKTELHETESSPLQNKTVVGGGTIEHEGVIDKKEVILNSTQNWLNSLKPGQYPNIFAGSEVGKAILVYTENKAPSFWIIPVKITKEDKEDKEGFTKTLYVGYVNAFEEFDDAPGAFTVYSQPYETLFSTTSEEAVQKILKENPQYNTTQISEPILMLLETGWWWYLESSTGEKFYVNPKFPYR